MDGLGNADLAGTGPPGPGPERAGASVAPTTGPGSLNGRTDAPGAKPTAAGLPDQRKEAPEIARAMTRRWISDVPSKIV